MEADGGDKVGVNGGGLEADSSGGMEATSGEQVGVDWRQTKAASGVN